MSNKPLKALSSPDIDLRLSSPVGMEEGIKQVILRRAGFEIFNTRPYHNYETWSDGYNVLGRRDGKAMSHEETARLVAGERSDHYLVIAGEDLDDAVRRFALSLQPELEQRRENAKVPRSGGKR